MGDRRRWAADRLHPSERGHRLIARHFHSGLAAAGCPVGPPPDPEPGNSPPTRLTEIAWLATKGTAWVVQRSTDLVPYLLLMALREAAGRDAASAPAPLQGSPRGGRGGPSGN